MTWLYVCYDCDYKHKSMDEFAPQKCSDWEPYGDHKVERVSYELTCPQCGGDSIEEDFFPPQ